MPYQQLRAALAAQTQAGARASRLLRLRDHGRGRGAAAGRDRGAAAGVRGRSRRARSRGRSSRSSAAPAARRSRTSGCSRERSETRDRVHFGRGLEGKVTAIAVFERGAAVQRPSVSAGRGRQALGPRRDPDRRPDRRERARRERAPVPAADAGVGRRRRRSRRRARLRVALAQLAEQDPLINVRQDDTRRELSVSLYGEVQKEVIQATLASEFGLDVAFRETTPICIERPDRHRRGSRDPARGVESVSRHDRAARRAGAERLGHRVPAATVDHAHVPLYVYKTARELHRAHGRVRPRGAARRASSAGRSPTAS